jgi:hypothetical protein
VTKLPTVFLLSTNELFAKAGLETDIYLNSYDVYADAAHPASPDRAFRTERV